MLEVSPPSDVEMLENELTSKKELVELGNMARRLYSNRDFKTLIIEGFMLKEAARYVQISGDPDLSPEQRQDALNIAQASGHLKRFLSIVIAAANHAGQTLEDTEVALNEARAEEQP